MIACMFVYFKNVPRHYNDNGLQQTNKLIYNGGNDNSDFGDSYVKVHICEIVCELWHSGATKAKKSEKNITYIHKTFFILNTKINDKV